MAEERIVLLYSAPPIPYLNSGAELLLVLTMLLSASFGGATLLAEKQLNHLPFCALATELVTKFRQSWVMNES